MWLTGNAPTFARPTSGGVRRATIDGLLILAQIAPGQVFFRIQLFASLAALGAGPTGLFYYVRQMINAGVQLVVFLMRAEFPRLLKLVSPGGPVLRVSLLALRVPLALGLIGSVGGLALGVLLTAAPVAKLQLVGSILITLSPLIASSVFCAVVGYAMLAVGLFARAAVIAVLGSIAGVAIVVFGVSRIGMAGLLVGELVSNIIVLLLCSLELHRVGRVHQTASAEISESERSLW